MILSTTVLNDTVAGKQVKVGGLHGCLMSIWVVTVILEYLSIY